MCSVPKKLLAAVLAVFMLVASIASALTNCQVPNCVMCSPTNEFLCQSCDPFYILSGGQCVPPTYCGVSNCNACVSGDPNRCAACNTGYVVSSSGLCAKKRRNGAAAPAAAMWTAAAAVAVAVAYVL